jgi:dihydroxyacetone kinase-like predicted kinase
MTNKTIDQSSFYFNPFETMDDEDSPDPINFDSYPNQENYIGSNDVEETVVTRPANNIIEDILSKNIISHRQRGEQPEPESFATSASNNEAMTYQQVMDSLKKDNWTLALKKEINNMADYHVWDVIKKTTQINLLTARGSLKSNLNCPMPFKSIKQGFAYKGLRRFLARTTVLHLRRLANSAWH